MPKSFSDEAVVLRAHNVGETDRFCILLTRKHGRMAVRITGARRLLSHRGRGLLPLHKVSITWEQHSFGNSVVASQCLDPHHGAWSDPHAFSCAEQGVELLLKLTEDGMPTDDVYALTVDFLAACSGPHSRVILHLFTLKLLKILGYLPESSSAPDMRPSRLMLAFLPTLDDVSFAHPPVFTAELEEELLLLVRSLVGSQLGLSLAAPLVSLSISSGVTPTCQ